jgi:monofunctional glycosyltransferase
MISCEQKGCKFRVIIGIIEAESKSVVSLELRNTFSNFTNLMALFKHRVIAKLWRFLVRLFVGIVVAQFLYILALKWVYPPITITQLSSLISGYGLKRDYVSWNEISLNAGLAVMASEDQLFYKHNGFDWKRIEEAMKYNKKKKKIRGASTISQQVAKNVFLWQGRSWFRKGLEVYFTFMIELVWGKERILDVYLNVIEMGKGIFGIEAASQSYFKKSAKKISQAEAAMIASCLPNPKKLIVKPLSKYINKRYPAVMQQMRFIRDVPEIKALLKL